MQIAATQPGVPHLIPGNVNFDGELDIEIGGLSSFDTLTVLDGSITFGSDALIKLLFENFTPPDGSTFDFLNGDVIGGLPNFDIEGLPAGFDFSIDGDGAGALQFAAEMPQGGGNGVPEPPAIALLGLGVATFRLVRRQKVLATA